MRGGVRLELGGGYHLSPIRAGDQPAYVEHLADRGITDFMVLIPFPYTPVHAEAWVSHNLDVLETQEVVHEFVIRRADGFLIGAIGITPMKGIGAHRGTLGYWLAEDYRGRGIATRAVLAAVAYAFDVLGLMRVEATTFLHNLASQRVLEKCGFTREGILAGYHCKNGRLVDVVMFAIVSAAPHR